MTREKPRSRVMRVTGHARYEEMSNERIASVSVTKGNNVSTLGRTAATECKKEKEYAGRSAAAGIWKR